MCLNNKTMKADNTAKRSTWSNILSSVGLLAIMVAAAMPLLKAGTDTAKYIYAAGAILLFAGKIIMPMVKEPLRLRRLMRMEIWTAIIFIVGAAFMFFLPGKDWIAFTLAGGVLTLYTSIMIPRQKITKE